MLLGCCCCSDQQPSAPPVRPDAAWLRFSGGPDPASLRALHAGRAAALGAVRTATEEAANAVPARSPRSVDGPAAYRDVLGLTLQPPSLLFAVVERM